MVEIFYDKYTVTEVLYGTYKPVVRGANAEESFFINYMPYEKIVISKTEFGSWGGYVADYTKQVKRTVGEEYLLLLMPYNNEWDAYTSHYQYSDFRLVIPADNPSAITVNGAPIAEKAHTVSLSDINTQEKFLQYALPLIKKAD